MEFAKSNQPIPEELLPFLENACNAYQEQMGNRITNPVTEQMWIIKIAAVEIFIDIGSAPGKAIKRAAKTVGIPCKTSSMSVKYYGADRGSFEVMAAKCDLLNEWRDL
jgi:hypothetical protein